jgi:Leucine-rich repeat (LRR) protein
MKIKTLILCFLIPFIGKTQNVLPEDELQNKPYFYSSFEEALANKEKATQLNQRNKNLDEIPDNIQMLTKLQVYTVMKNKIKTLRPQLFECKELKELIVRNNLLTEIPENIGNLTKLTFFNTGYNKLNKLPENIGKLKNLNINARNKD